MSTIEDASREAGAAMPTSPPRENIVRALYEPQAVELRATTDDGMPTMMVGHFSVFNQWTEINSVFEGQFLERIAPGAFAKTFQERSPKVLFNHGSDPQVGDKVLGSVSSLEEDAYGARYEVEMFDTSYNRDLVPGLRAGAYGASFRFAVVQEDFVQRPKRSDFNPTGLPERTIKEARVMEFGPVTFPAYANATAGVRSLTDDFMAERLLSSDDMLERLAERIASKTRNEPFTISFSGIGAQVAPVAQPEERVEEISEPDEALEDRAEMDVPEPSEATTVIETTEPEPPEATTRAVSPNKGLFTTNREEKPAWLL